ncbi:UDP-N-acetylmuramoyl-tripeptide--D-alanyl-D-alanine ligase [Celeribacter arenosi]|uniref:UDP-N-acetylmuramoyl-tripeptide--D-alanyl-D-alanine ligase n=1 Tax=Celeribacter arenosi TaxID=792649 RepID=A0ABP7JU36_9RHOB
MSVLWTSDDAVAATGGRATRAFEVNGVSIDTRTIQPGDLFVALQAARDGHDFVAQALEKGAGAALVSRVPDGVGDDAPLLIVDDVLGALERLGAAARARVRGKVVAVTGSVGKTSTKEMLRAMLAPQGATHAAEASYNNHWGVPLTLARMPADTDFAVIEIGMNHPGEIGPLARLARPDVAMITTIAPAHLAAFDDISGIAREKSAIFEGLVDGGAAVFHGDLETTPILADAWNGTALSFGEGDANSVRVDDIRLLDGDATARVTVDGAAYPVRLSTSGRHFLTNAAGCLAVAQLLGVDMTRAAADLSRWDPPSGRGARGTVQLPLGGTLDLIDDAFNANPTSMSAALEVLAAARPEGSGRRVAILGDMLELGEDERAIHAGLAALPWFATIDVVHTVGPLMSGLHNALAPKTAGVHVETAEEMRSMLGTLVVSGDIVLVKGSKGSKVSVLVDAIRQLGQPLPDKKL